MKAIFEPVYNTAGVEQLNKELAKDGGRTVAVLTRRSCIFQVL